MAIARVQKAENDAGGSTFSSITVTLPAATTAGNLLVAHVFDDNGSETITPPANWVLIANQSAPGADNCSALFYYANNPGGLTSFTFTRAGAQIWALSAVVVEYSGIATASPKDVSDVDFGNSGTAGGGSLVTTNAADLLIFAVGSGNASINSVSAGWTMLENHALFSGTGAAIAERIVAATGTYSPTMPLAGGSNWEGIQAAFKAAAGGSTPITVPTDAAAGGDTGQPTTTTAVPLADAGAGIDSILADAGAGADSPGITAANPLPTDPASGADAILGGEGTGGDSTGVGVTLAPPNDGGTGSDVGQPTIAAAIPLPNDPGTGGDGVVVQTGGNQSPQVADATVGADSILANAGAGTDSPGISVSVPLAADPSTGADAGQPTVGASFTQADTAIGGDAGQPSALGASVPLATDGSTGADNPTALAASAPLADAGGGTDAPAGVQVIIPALADPGTGLDAPTISTPLALPTDAATGGDVVGSPAVQAPVGDPGAEADAPSGVAASFTQADGAAGSDFSSVPQGSQKAVPVADAGTGADVALLAFRWRGPRILGATTEQGAVIARAGRGTNP